MCDVLLEMALIWRWQGGTSCRLTRSLHSRRAAPCLLAARFYALGLDFGSRARSRRPRESKILKWQSEGIQIG